MIAHVSDKAYQTLDSIFISECFIVIITPCVLLEELRPLCNGCISLHGSFAILRTQICIKGKHLLHVW